MQLFHPNTRSLSGFVIEHVGLLKVAPTVPVVGLHCLPLVASLEKQKETKPTKIHFIIVIIIIIIIMSIFIFIFIVIVERTISGFKSLLKERRQCGTAKRVLENWRTVLQKSSESSLSDICFGPSLFVAQTIQLS